MAKHSSKIKRIFCHFSHTLIIFLTSLQLSFDSGLRPSFIATSLHEIFLSLIPFLAVGVSVLLTVVATSHIHLEGFQSICLFVLI